MEDSKIRFCILCQAIVDKDHEQDEWHLRRYGKAKIDVDTSMLTSIVFTFTEEGFLTLQTELGQEFKPYAERTAFSYIDEKELLKLHNKCKEIVEYETELSRMLTFSLEEVEVDAEQRRIQEAYDTISKSKVDVDENYDEEFEYSSLSENESSDE
jgi:hypothetical protein